MLVRWDIPAAARGSRSAGTRPGILTGVLEATMRDLQVKTPAPGFLTGSHPKVVRRHGQPAHTVPPRGRPAQSPAARRQQPQPAQDPHHPDFHAARPSTGCNELSLRFFKGAPSARHAYGRNRLRELARATGGEQNGRVTSDKRQGSPGVSPSLGGSFRRALRAEALRRDELPRMAAPAPAAAGPRRHAPMPCHTSRARPSRSRRERR